MNARPTSMRAVHGLVLLGVMIFATGQLLGQTVTVVNMIPNALSAEANQDSEPDITVNPNNPLEIIATAFTPNPTGATTTAPIFISQDGGATWVLNNIVPSGNGMTGDITVGLSRNNVLYAGILRGGSGLDMRLLRSNTYLTATAMTQLMGRTNEDQPYTRVYAPMAGGLRDKDLLYVGHNDFGNGPRTASIEQSLDAATAPAPAGLGPIRIERRTPSGQDGPPIRQAIHADGTVYAVYDQITVLAAAGPVFNITSNIVVVRDDDWGQGALPYADLVDPSDSVAGRLVATGISWVFNPNSVFGQERMADRLSIAVDPRDSNTVYVAWTDRPSVASGNTSNIHMRRSTNGGVTWSAADLLTVNTATVPQLAVNVRGDVGFVYQQLATVGATQRWQTHFRQSFNGGTSWTDTTLADTPSTQPTQAFLPYLGDYLGLSAVGKDFVGIFSASNSPVSANFPNGVTYQRVSDFTANTLGDGAGGTTSISIDPFFFRIENQPPNQDFYVRDWTDTPTSFDTGLEPSTKPRFYKTSDVWNRRSNVAGGFNVNDQPNSEDPWPSTLGNNFAFTRVHRKATGAATTVNLHFLKSEFGTGSNYVNAAATADPTLSFSAGDSVQTMSSGYQWDLIATTSSHVCLAVEISTPADPVTAPSLLGRAPGWPTTDLMVINDNNKGQRNLGVYTMAGSGSITYWAIVHNAADFVRNFVLDIELDSDFERLFEQAEIQVVGPGKHRIRGGEVVLFDMPPGENRWVGLTIPVTERQKEGQPASVSFTEIVDSLPVNGFTIQQTRAPFKVAAADGLRLLGGNLNRMGHIMKNDRLIELAKKIGKLATKEVGSEDYVKILQDASETYKTALGQALRQTDQDPFGLKNRIEKTFAALEKGDPERILPAQSDLDHAVDAFLTFQLKEKGDLADARQMIRWQDRILKDVRLIGELSTLESVPDVEATYTSAKSDDLATNYASHLKKSLPCFREIDKMFELNQQKLLSQLEKSGDKPETAQRLHREFLTSVDAAASTYRNMDPMASFVFQGTVESANESTLSLLAANETTYKVKVDKVLIQEGSVRVKPGSSITVVDEKRSLKAGEQHVFHTEPFMFGESVAAKLTNTTDDQEFNVGLVQEAKLRRALKLRVENAQLIVTGSIERTEAFKDAPFRLTEHQPQLAKAFLKVDGVLQGDQQGENVSFVFAQGKDVHWFRCPKFKAGDKGVFMLSRRSQLVGELGLKSEEFVLFDELDYVPDGQEMIKGLLGR